MESRELLGDKMRGLQQESIDNAWRERPHLHIKKLMQAQRLHYVMDVPSAQVLADMLPIAFELGAEHEKPAQAAPHEITDSELGPRDSLRTHAAGTRAARARAEQDAAACPKNGWFVHSRVRYDESSGRRVAVCADCGARNDGTGGGWAR